VTGIYELYFNTCNYCKFSYLSCCCCFGVSVGGSMQPSPTLPVMNNKMHMNFSFQCLMEFMKRWTRIGVSHTMKVMYSKTKTQVYWFHFL